MKDIIKEPSEIERKSFEIISGILGDRKFDPLEEPIIKRVIHTSADFEYADNLKFSPNAVVNGIKAVQSGCGIVTDTLMGLSGINKRLLAKFNCSVTCYIRDEDVAREAKQRNETRSIVSMEHAVKNPANRIFAIGNAPTALIRLGELIKENAVNPALVIGVPVGFVNVVEAKEFFKTCGCSYIIADGRKGGSNICASIINAILLEALEYRENA